MNEREKIVSVFTDVIKNSCLKKVVFSKSTSANAIRAIGRLFTSNKGEYFIQLETFTTDNKALHKNITLSSAPEILTEMAMRDYMQTNIIATSGQCEIKVSKKGKISVLNRIVCKEPIKIESHDRQKNYILACAPGHEKFLYLLGLANESGKILDKKQSKFRQINRFIEHLDDVYVALPSEGELTVCDLCCGKSYLTFAVYYYLTEIKGRKIKMYGVDLKKDVIAYCTDVATRLSCTDLEFICSDISEFSCENIDLVISLHACDIATDIVLGYAIKHRARLILSTPCCHHEMMGQINCEELSFITKHSMLAQKLCDAATDSLRCLMLEANGYRVDALELIDPDDTPKNLLIRAILDPSANAKKCCDHRKRYEEACRFLGVSPFLDKLMKENESER